ncbi:MAG TPA: glycoside hydrolase family 95 protein, partial [Chitinophagaceae bacterium]|nr:glycoside hydrolase family 95 protein [Chitinophagaceae bacterium]
MKKTGILFIIACSVIALPAIGQQSPSNPYLKLWYSKPAVSWEEALPLGNGKTGAMVFGGVAREHFQLNDNTLWSGFPASGNNPNGPTVLPQVRQAVFRGDYDSAAILWKKMQGPYSARYLPLGDLWLDFTAKDSVTSSYYRDLDLNNATTTVKYTINGITYRRETFISYPDKLMVIRISADKKGAVGFTASLSSKLRYKVAATDAGGLVLKGKAPKFVANRDYEPKQVEYDENPNGEGMNFEVQVKILAQGGSVKKAGDRLAVADADAVTIYLTEAT